MSEALRPGARPPAVGAETKWRRGQPPSEIVGVPALYLNQSSQLAAVCGRLDELLAREAPNRRSVRVLRKPTILTPEQRRAAADAYRSGVTVDLVAREFDVTRNVVLRILDEFDAHVRPSKRKLSDADNAVILQLDGAGVSVARIAEQFGVDHRTIRRELSR